MADATHVVLGQTDIALKADFSGLTQVIGGILEAQRRERPQRRGVLTPLGQGYEIISAPVDIEPRHRKPQVEVRRRGARPLRKGTRNRLEGRSSPDLAALSHEEDRNNANDRLAPCEEDSTADILEGVEAVERFPRDALRTSEGRVRTVRGGGHTMRHSFSDGAHADSAGAPATQ